MNESQIEEILDTLRSRFPNWKDFSDEAFVDDEITYKREAVEFASEQLGKPEFQALIDGERYDEIIARIKSIAAKTNFFYLATPTQGDLGVVHAPGLDKASFSTAFFNLLYGEGDSPKRLAQFVDYCERANLPCKWTFCTGFLFLLQPQTDVFVKPQTTTRFFRYLKIDRKARGKPDPATYRFILELSNELLDGLKAYGARDMVDVQSVMWVVASVTQATRFWKVSPGEKAIQWDECRREGSIGVGWDQLGDVSGLTRDEFLAKTEECKRTIDGWKLPASEQVWKWVNEVKEGDRIVANDGTHHILGVGTVTGPHYYAEGQRYTHRVPVRWDITEPFSVDEGGWRRTLIELSEEKFKRLTADQGASEASSESGWFTKETFELLTGLTDQPTAEFYSKHKDRFVASVEAPFKSLMRDLASKLPTPVGKLLETEKGTIGRIRKNDYGRGGAWDFYWGAFYPKGGKRTDNAQLYVSIYGAHCEFGFAFGNSSNEDRKRFDAAVANQRADLLEVLPQAITVVDLEFGSARAKGGKPSGSESKNISEWLTNLKGGSGVRVCRILTPADVLKMTKESLVSEIADMFVQFFPFMLLAAHDDALPEIQRFLGLNDEENREHPEYSVELMAAETGLQETDLARWVAAIERKGQAVLYGPPGTGKTFVAERLAKHLVGGGGGVYKLIQFHPAYAYEDFIQGIRPTIGTTGDLSYQMVAGGFREFCQRASSRNGTSVLIIDEINRANLSRVFGELMYLLEYRDQQVPLAGGGTLSIPDDVRIIGTMNTADRSIALVDHALRRRFAFIALAPNMDVLRRYHRDTDVDVDALAGLLAEVNRQIGDAHYEVGISFFLRKDLDRHLEDIWRMEIEPYLEEYFFDQKDKADGFKWDRIQGRLIS